jgi:hypothetical protein
MYLTEMGISVSTVTSGCTWITSDCFFLHNKDKELQQTSHYHLLIGKILHSRPLGAWLET